MLNINFMQIRSMRTPAPLGQTAHSLLSWHYKDSFIFTTRVTDRVKEVLRWSPVFRHYVCPGETLKYGFRIPKEKFN